jgi:hypothetical protein
MARGGEVMRAVAFDSGESAHKLLGGIPSQKAKPETSGKQVRLV